MNPQYPRFRFLDRRFVIGPHIHFQPLSRESCKGRGGCWSWRWFKRFAPCQLLADHGLVFHGPGPGVFRASFTKAIPLEAEIDPPGISYLSYSHIYCQSFFDSIRFRSRYASTSAPANLSEPLILKKGSSRCSTIRYAVTVDILSALASSWMVSSSVTEVRCAERLESSIFNC